MTGGDVADHGIGIEVTEEADPERGREGGREDINNLCHVLILFARNSVTFSHAIGSLLSLASHTRVCS